MTLDKEGLKAAVTKLSEHGYTAAVPQYAQMAIEAYLAHTRPLPADIAELVGRLRNRADTMNGIRPVGASDGCGTMEVGYYSSGDQKLDREAASALEALGGVEKPKHSDKLKASLESAAKSLKSRPPELRGPFTSSATKATPEGVERKSGKSKLVYNKTTRTIDTVKAPEGVEPVTVDVDIILAGIKQFGLAADGSDLRDIAARAQRLTDRAEKAERECKSLTACIEARDHSIELVAAERDTLRDRLEKVTEALERAIYNITHLSSAEEDEKYRPVIHKTVVEELRTALNPEVVKD
jgi:hypothetical protein